MSTGNLEGVSAPLWVACALVRSNHSQLGDTSKYDMGRNDRFRRLFE